jgi:putative sterol carrier protein
MAITSARDAVDELGDRWNPARLPDLVAVVQYELSDPLPGDTDRVHVVFDRGTTTVVEGQHPSPSTTIRMKAADFVAMTNGQFDMGRAVMTRAIKIVGNLGVARRMALAR